MPETSPRPSGPGKDSARRREISIRRRRWAEPNLRKTYITVGVDRYIGEELFSLSLLEEEPLIRASSLERFYTTIFHRTVMSTGEKTLGSEEREQ